MFKITSDLLFPSCNVDDQYARVFNFVKNVLPVPLYLRNREAKKLIDRLDQIERGPIQFSSNCKQASQTTPLLSDLETGEELLESLKWDSNNNSKKIALKLQRRL